jgi:hypothetical protein
MVQLVNLDKRLFPSFSAKYEREFQAKTAYTRQIYSDLVTRAIFVVFLVWLVIDFFLLPHVSNLVWISHASAMALTGLLWLFMRSHFFTEVWAEWVVGPGLFCIFFAVLLRRNP